MAKKVFELCIQYLNGDHPSGLGAIKEVDIDLEKAIGYCHSSGSGFGARDMQWDFSSKMQADNAADKVKLVFKKHGLKITKDGNMVLVRQVNRDLIEA